MDILRNPDYYKLYRAPCVFPEIEDCISQWPCLSDSKFGLHLKFFNTPIEKEQKEKKTVQNRLG